jgi:RNA polymerase sigma factor (sigma-70 family)
VFGTCWLLCRDSSLAEEATQEAFARALERWRRIGHEPWRGGYVTAMAVNLIRRARRASETTRAMAVPGVDQTAPLDTAEASAVWDAVAELPRRERQATVLFYRLGLPVEETASAMGCRPSTVRAHLSRARDRLRPLLREEAAHEESNHGRT